MINFNGMLLLSLKNQREPQEPGKVQFMGFFCALCTLSSVHPLSPTKETWGTRCCFVLKSQLHYMLWDKFFLTAILW